MNALDLLQPPSIEHVEEGIKAIDRALQLREIFLARQKDADAARREYEAACGTARALTVLATDSERVAA